MLKSEEKDVFRELQKHLDKMPIGFPATKSGSDIRILKKLFTAEEAEIATFLKFGWERDLETLDVIYNRVEDKKITKEELRTMLDEMGHRGLIMTKR